MLFTSLVLVFCNFDKLMLHLFYCCSNVNIECLRRRTGWQYQLFPLLIDVLLPAEKAAVERARNSTVVTSGGDLMDRRASTFVRSDPVSERKKEMEKAHRQVYAFVMHVFALAHIHSFSKVSGGVSNICSLLASYVGLFLH